MTNKWTVSLGVASLLTALSFVVAISLGWVDPASFSMVEAFAVFTSYACVVLCNYQSRWNYPIGIASQVAYSYIFWTGGLYALAAFNLYLVISLTYGFLFWKADRATVPVTRVEGLKNWTGYGIFGIFILAFFVGMVYIIEPSNFSNISKIDALIAALSGVAQLLLDRKKIQTWHVWTVVNIISIPYYFHLGYYFVTFQYLFFLTNTAIGYMAWRKTMDKSTNVHNNPRDLSVDRGGDFLGVRVGVL